jgi:hypothetical protein
MIKIRGSVHRSFLFPADLPTAFAFYSDVRRILHYLPHISMVKEYTDTSYRMLYNSTELGIYRVNIYCDLIAELKQNEYTLVISPLNGLSYPVKAAAGIYSLVSHGYFSSTSVFHPDNGKTQVDYYLEIHSELPVPLAMRLVPAGILESIANNLAHWRMDEIAGGFIDRSLRAYQQLIAFSLLA